ncbi:mitochondrial S-adenosylmethionine carrier protein isoform X1 [Patella vulgata]|uniref:mitochondrial S-adenosylmethionine carrier protein isoform X1 n=1 Tax=Patella vulgata TaxID=6465 RepID=UPI0021803A35|nr:mitochondrial S-adenosylmethionine carrier protein isoform X1 [Patella vulgata]
MDDKIDFRVALIAGGAAGTSADIILYPLDTIKTRLQSQNGFIGSGGFRGIYSGLFSAALGSAPTAALFFCTYESTKYVTKTVIGPTWEPVAHMSGATVGEIAACLLRVPVEVVKQRAQATSGISSLSSLRKTIATDGLSGLYRGFFVTVSREIPFSLIQFPLWEIFKKSWSNKQQQPIKAWQSSLCGAVAGGIAAALTTPLDVAKTRIILAQSGSIVASGNIMVALKEVYLQKGFTGLWAGVAPRVMWISIGGAVFLGVYEKVCIEATKYYS